MARKGVIPTPPPIKRRYLYLYNQKEEFQDVQYESKKHLTDDILRNVMYFHFMGNR
jgi:hypothetical protein